MGGLNGADKSQVLLRALQKERHERKLKEKQFVRLLDDEKKAREVAEKSLENLSHKLDTIAEGLGLDHSAKGGKGFLRRTRARV